MSLVRNIEEVDSNVVALTCHGCGRRYAGDEMEELMAADWLLRCECGVSGFVAHRAAPMDERFPDPLGAAWVPVPRALFEHVEALRLGPHELLVVCALESHRRTMGDEVFPSLARIAALTALSPHKVKRATARLVELGLVERHRGRLRNGRRTTSSYVLDPLWRRLAALESATMAHGCAMDHGANQGSTMAHGCASEVEAVEELEAKKERDPEARAAARGSSPILRVVA